MLNLTFVADEPSHRAETFQLITHQRITSYPTKSHKDSPIQQVLILNKRHPTIRKPDYLWRNDFFISCVFVGVGGPCYTGTDTPFQFSTDNSRIFFEYAFSEVRERSDDGEKEAETLPDPGIPAFVFTLPGPGLRATHHTSDRADW